MNTKDIKQYCFNNAWNNKCDGACGPHRGECVVVEVERWGYFSYCEEAIEEDKRRGLVVNVLNLATVEDTRTERQKMRDELGWPMEGQGR